MVSSQRKHLDNINMGAISDTCIQCLPEETVSYWSNTLFSYELLIVLGFTFLRTDINSPAIFQTST